MRAVNLIPQEGRSSGRQVRLASDSLGATHAIVAALVIVAVLVLLRVLAGNTVSDRTQTLATIQSQVATEQAMAQRLGNDASFIQAAEQREDAIRSIAEARFPWQQSLDQLAEVMPATTSLSSLSATSAGAGATSTGPQFTLTGCADTANQDGTATLLRRLQLLSGSPQVGFQSSTRTAHCGNSFDITVDYGSGATTTTTAAAATTSPATSTASSATSTTPSAASTTTTSTAPTTTTAPTGTATTEGAG